MFAGLLLFIAAADPAIDFEGGDGPGKGKHVVLVGGDEEYRSEEALPQLAKILSRRHGFRCTVLLSLGKDGTIDPTATGNITGTDTLATADLLVIATRYRDLPDDQMKPFDDYLKAGKPVIGLRTATHAFNFGKGKTSYARYSSGHKGDGWDGGFGRVVLGETWVSHHGNHGKESTRGVVAPGAAGDPVLRGIHDGDVWGTTDVYTVNLPMRPDCKPLLLGQVLTGMKPTDPPVVGKKNEPMMPVAWTKTYHLEGGPVGRVFTTTMGASQDFATEGTRRLFVNAVYWTLGLEDRIPESADVALVGEYKPTPFGFGKHVKGVRPADLAKE